MSDGRRHNVGKRARLALGVKAISIVSEDIIALGVVALRVVASNIVALGIIAHHIVALRIEALHIIAHHIVALCIEALLVEASSIVAVGVVPEGIEALGIVTLKIVSVVIETLGIEADTVESINIESGCIIYILSGSWLPRLVYITDGVAEAIPAGLDGRIGNALDTQTEEVERSGDRLHHCECGRKNDGLATSLLVLAAPEPLYAKCTLRLALGECHKTIVVHGKIQGGDFKPLFCRKGRPCSDTHF